MSQSAFLHTVKWFQVLLYKSQFNISHLFAHTVCSIWSTDMTLSGATIPDQSWPESIDNDGVLHIPQISKAGALPLDCLVSYGRHLEGGLTLYRDAVGVFYNHTWTGLFYAV